MEVATPVCSYLTVLIWILIRGCLSQNDTAIEVAVVEENIQGSQQDAASLPSNLNMTINLFQNDTNAVDLNLHMNNAMNEQRSIYVIRTNKEGQSVLEKEQIPIEGNIAFYQDTDTGANVMVRCDGYAAGMCDPTLEGSFFVDKVEYGLEPLSVDSAGRKKRSSSHAKGRGKLYSVFKRKQNKPVKDDFQKDSAAGSNGQSMQMVDRIVDLSEFLNPETSSMRMMNRISHINRVRTRTHIKDPDIPYEIGLILVIDFSVYQSWYKRSTKKSHVEKDIDAKSRIRQYMSHVVNGIDLRFRNLRTNRIRVLVSRYIIADTQSASSWTSDRLGAQPRDLIYADNVLNKLIKWRYGMRSNLPDHDHLILFTAHDLYRPTLANKGVAGFARVKSMCTHTSVSVVEEHGGFTSVLTATHEIGHSLGAYHDGHKNKCDGQDNYIMTPIGGSATPSNVLNPYHFSSCSEDAFNAYLDKLPKENCLTDETDIHDDDEFREHLLQKAGQLYGPNEQCRQHLGPSSYYAWGGILGDASEVCTHMACKNEMSETSFNIYYAARGTSCGNKQWCIGGVCTYSREAPEREDMCVHGDSQRKFGNQTCAQYISANPSKCYLSYYNRFCCMSCNKVRRKDRDCEFGNRRKMCDVVDQKARFCYHGDNERMCCESCKRHYTGVKGCEFGDRLPVCNPLQCHNQNHTSKCCKTCGQVTRKITTTFPASSLSDADLQDKEISADITATNLESDVTPLNSSPNQTTSTGLDQSTVSHSSNTIRPLVELPTVTNTHQLKSQGYPYPLRKTPFKKRTTQGVTTITRSISMAPFRLSKKSSSLDHLKQRPHSKNHSAKNWRQQQTSVSKEPFTRFNRYGFPKYAKRTKKAKSSSMRVITTTFRTSISKIKETMEKLTQPPKQCVRPDATFMSLKCGWLVRLMKGLCSNTLLGSMCCEPCAPAKRNGFICKDQPGCTASTGAHCYNDMVRSKCCSTCKRFETDYEDCRYGDRGKHCDLFLNYMPTYTCSAFKQRCCLSCKTKEEKLNSISNVPVQSLVRTERRQSRNKRIWR